MLVTGESIIDKNLLEGIERSNVKSGGYYLRIHKIIPYPSEAETNPSYEPVDTYALKPGCSAWIVSEEVFKINDTSITALVTLRSGFTKKGMMALDVGLVDSNYHGPIGTVVINISKNDILLQKHEEFFRVLFIQHDVVEAEFQYPVSKYTHEAYIRERAAEIARDFPGTFLRMGEIEQRILDRLAAGEAIKLESKIVDQVLSALLKKYWLKLLLAFLVLVVLLGIVILICVPIVVPDGLTLEDIRKAMRNGELSIQIDAPPTEAKD